MRILDPNQPLHPRPPSRKKKKKRQQRFHRYFKARVKVPTEEEPASDSYEDVKNFVNNTWAPNCRGPEGVRDEVEVCVRGDDEDCVYRISIWGDDDLGYERVWDHAETDVETLVRYVLSFPEPLTFEWLEQEGFGPV
jgi:hypothetical protein